jgi:hypothetical protein
MRPSAFTRVFVFLLSRVLAAGAALGIVVALEVALSRPIPEARAVVRIAPARPAVGTYEGSVN